MLDEKAVLQENERLKREVDLLRKIVGLYEKLDENKNFPRPMSVDIKNDVFGPHRNISPVTHGGSICDVYFKNSNFKVGLSD